MKRTKITILFLILAQLAFGQIHVQVQWGTESITLGKSYAYGKDSISFDQLKLYLTDFQFEGSTRKAIKVGAHLIDLESPESMNLFTEFSTGNYRTMSFQFGLDSSYHVSESVTGDLDPLKGMYWAWNSGYIQFKCTGKSTRIPTDDRLFEYHLGGYRKPNETMVHVTIEMKGDILVLDLKPFFEKDAQLEQVQRIMIPSPLAKSYCQSIAYYFYSK